MAIHSSLSLITTFCVLLLAGTGADQQKGDMDSLLTSVEETIEEADTAASDKEVETPAAAQWVKEQGKRLRGGRAADKTAAMVDSVLVSKAEEGLAQAEDGDPLLADPLVSLEDEEEDQV